MFYWIQYTTEARKLRVELERWLGEASLVSSSVASTPSGLTTDKTVTGTDVDILVSDGDAGTNYTITLTCLTSDGRSRDFIGNVKVVAPPS
jgi:hypothetical protein